MANKVKPWYRSKTIIFNALWLVVGIAGFFGFREFQPDPQVESLLSVVGALLPIVAPLLNLYLRKVTNQPIG